MGVRLILTNFERCLRFYNILNIMALTKPNSTLCQFGMMHLFFKFGQILKFPNLLMAHSRKTL